MINSRRVLLNEEQASDVVGFKVATLRRRRWQGLPPRYLKVGGKVLYDHQDLEKYLDSCVRDSTSQIEAPSYLSTRDWVRGPD